MNPIPMLLLATLGAAEVTPLNGDFEQADPGDAPRPLGWDQPDGLGVAWLTAPGQGHGKAIRIDTRPSERDMVARWKQVGITRWDIPEPGKNPVAETYGLSLYSAAFPCQAGRPYRVRWSFVGNAGGVKVWVRGYREGSERRCYEAVSEGGARLAGASQQWREVVHCFHPTAKTPQVATLRVMLYAFYPAAEYWFDNVTVEAISDGEYAAYKRDEGSPTKAKGH